MKEHAEFLVHPALGIIELDQTQIAPPLTEKQMPQDWLALGEDQQEIRLRRAWSLICEWLLTQDADHVAAWPVEAKDRRMLEEVGFSGGQQLSAPVTPARLAALVETNCESLSVSKGDRQLFELYDTWDGMVLFARRRSSLHALEVALRPSGIDGHSPHVASAPSTATHQTDLRRHRT